MALTGAAGDQTAAASIAIVRPLAAPGVGRACHADSTYVRSVDVSRSIAISPAPTQPTTASMTAAPTMSALYQPADEPRLRASTQASAKESVARQICSADARRLPFPANVTIAHARSKRPTTQHEEPVAGPSLEVATTPMAAARMASEIQRVHFRGHGSRHQHPKRRTVIDVPTHGRLRPSDQHDTCPFNARSEHEELRLLLHCRPTSTSNLAGIIACGRGQARSDDRSPLRVHARSHFLLCDWKHAKVPLPLRPP